MNSPKPRIRPKPDPYRWQSEPPPHDPHSYPEHDLPVFSKGEPGAKHVAPERVIFHEDDCLR